MRGTIDWGALVMAPIRFWLGAGAFLLVLGGMSYGYGAWYAGVLLKDAAPVREIRANSSWTAQFQYEEVDGVRRRVDLPGPERFAIDVALDDLASADPAAGGFSGTGAVLSELGDPDDDEDKAKQEQGAVSREELIRNLRDSGILTSGGDPSSWRETVQVGEGLTEDEARAKAEAFRKTGRDVEVETYTDGSGETRYRLNYGRVRTTEEAEALRRELAGAGLIGGTGSQPPSNGGGTTTTPPTDPTGPTEPTGPTGPGPGPEGPSGGGTTTTPPTGPAPSGGETGGGRTVRDL